MAAASKAGLYTSAGSQPTPRFSVQVLSWSPRASSLPTAAEVSTARSRRRGASAAAGRHPRVRVERVTHELRRPGRHHDLASTPFEGPELEGALVWRSNIATMAWALAVVRLFLVLSAHAFHPPLPTRFWRTSALSAHSGNEVFVRSIAWKADARMLRADGAARRRARGCRRRSAVVAPRSTVTFGRAAAEAAIARGSACSARGRNHRGCRQPASDARDPRPGLLDAPRTRARAGRGVPARPGELVSTTAKWHPAARARETARSRSSTRCARAGLRRRVQPRGPLGGEKGGRWDARSRCSDADARCRADAHQFQHGDGRVRPRRKVGSPRRAARDGRRAASRRT